MDTFFTYVNVKMVGFAPFALYPKLNKHDFSDGLAPCVIFLHPHGPNKIVENIIVVIQSDLNVRISRILISPAANWIYQLSSLRIGLLQCPLLENIPQNDVLL